MVEINKTLTLTEKTLLRSLAGHTITNIDMAIAATPDIAWNTVRVHTDENDIDINCFLEELVLNDIGDTEEFGIVSICEAPCKALDVPAIAVDTSVVSINQKVDDVSIVNDSVAIYDGSQNVYKRATTKCIILHTSAGVIVIDRQNWFDESFAVNQGHDSSSLVSNEWEDWEDDDEEEPDIHYEFSTEVINL